jgi:hypothetical protein
MEQNPKLLKLKLQKSSIWWSLIGLSVTLSQYGVMWFAADWRLPLTVVGIQFIAHIMSKKASTPVIVVDEDGTNGQAKP